MTTKNQLLNLLLNNKERFISGEHIASQLQVSRNSVWKAVEQLRKEGYEIESKPRVGYKLITIGNCLSLNTIMDYVNCDCKVKIFESVDSTNNVAKDITVDDIPVIVISNKQTSGRGRLGRTFISPGGTGLYLTIVVKPNFDLTKSIYVTIAAAVALSKAIESVVGVPIGIKWVNDLFYDGKKVCGILTEAQSNFETGKIDKLIIGMGVNCFPSQFPEDLNNIVGSISTEYNSFSRSILAAEIINQTLDTISNLNTSNFLEDYKKRCFILNEIVYVHPTFGNDSFKCKALDIDNNGGLIVEYLEGANKGQVVSLTTGEVSVRIRG